MLLSMTGFSSADIDLINEKGEHLILSVELKTLNTRFFESSCRLPSGLSYLEHRVTSILKKHLIRGRAFLTIKVSTQGASLERVVPSHDIAKGYIEAARELKEEFGLKGEMSLSDFLVLPNLFVFEKGSVSSEQESLFLQKLQEIIDALLLSRKHEGDELEQDLLSRFTNCSAIIKSINSLAAKEVYKKKLLIQDALALTEKGDEQAKVRLEELYRALDKVDIHEEVTRFQSHLKAVELIFKDEVDMSKGRRLDFVLQELMREVNTITAKCSSYAISSAAVDIKVELEKAREQMQNIV